MKLIIALKSWKACITLLFVGLISIALGAVQLSSITSGDAEGNYLTHSTPIVLHIVFGIIFNLVSPFQFVSPIRKRYPKFHRFTGIILTVAAIVVAVTALWMNQYFPSFGGDLKYSGIVAYNIVLIGSMVLAIYSAIKGNINNHKKWMMRAMAAALGPSTQRLIIIPVFVLFGEGVLTNLIIGLLIWAGLLINLGVVEVILKRCQRVKIINNEAESGLKVAGNH